MTDIHVGRMSRKGRSRVPMVLALLVWCMGLIPVSLSAKGIVTVQGESTYYDNGTHSKVECMKFALEQARIDALAREFGTLVSQDIMQSDRVTGSREKNDFLALSSTQVKGEWIADEGEPVYTFDHDKDANLIVTCRVRGKAKEISNESAEFEAVVLRNGTDKVHTDNRFRHGDSLYLYFKGSTNGYLTVFLQDEADNVIQLLPYYNDSKTRIPVKGGWEYVYFDPDRADNTTDFEGLVMTAPNNLEYNRLYVIFSPNAFSAPVMTRNPGELPYMAAGEFSKWLVKSRRNDSAMGVKIINIEINPIN